MTEPKRYTIETGSSGGSIFSVKTKGVPDEDGQWIFDPDHKIDLSECPAEEKRINKTILKTSRELIEWLKQYPDIDVDVHASTYFRIEYCPPHEFCKKPYISIVGTNHKE